MGRVYPPVKAIDASRLEDRPGDDDGFDTDVDHDVIRLLQENARLRALVTQLSSLVLKHVAEQK
jgi:hypothetical protein